MVQSKINSNIKHVFLSTNLKHVKIVMDQTNFKYIITKFNIIV